jgi:excisionase family DNA binding protein
MMNADTIDKPDTKPNEVMTAEEVAAMMRIHPVTVRLQAAAGKIPGRRLGNRWRFSRSAITEWLAGK